jgi:hypothetical protein
MTGSPPINIDLRNDAIGGSASNALFVDRLDSRCGLPPHVPVCRIRSPNEFLHIPVVSKCTAICHVLKIQVDAVDWRDSDRGIDFLSHEGDIAIRVIPSNTICDSFLSL